MYAPDGFASLACALHQQCWFLSYQEPFIHLIQIFNTLPLFILLQTIIWFVLIGTIYYLTKELKIKNILPTTIILLLGTSFFIDNFIGSFENDCIGIILILLGFIFYYKYKNNNTKILQKNIHNLLTSISFFLISTTYWMWPGYLIRMPLITNHIVEAVFWTHWLGYMLLLPIIICCIISGIKYKDKTKILAMLFILFIPKLFILGIPVLLKFIDEIIHKMLKKDNMKFLITILIIGLIIGQGLRVGIYTYNSWTRVILDEECVTVNDEYFLRATKSLNYSYNQIYNRSLDTCKQTKLE